MRLFYPFPLLSLLALFATASFGDAPVTVERHPARLFGYQLGDVIEDTVDLHLAQGVTLDTEALPKLGKRLGWFMVRKITSSPLPHNGEGTALRLTLEVQLIDNPTQVRSLTVPPILLKFKGPTPLEDIIPSLTIDAAPLDTGNIRTGLPEFADLRPAPLIPTQDYVEGLKAWGMLAAGSLLWTLALLALAFRKNRTPRPFHDCERLLRHRFARSSSLDAWKLLFQEVHRAFDRAHGYRLFLRDVPHFCETYGADAPLSALTEDFFVSSERLFFSEDEAAWDWHKEGLKLKALLKNWRRLERSRHR